MPQSLNIDLGLFPIIAIVVISVCVFLGYIIFCLNMYKKNKKLDKNYENIAVTTLVCLSAISILFYMSVRDIGRSIVDENSSANYVVAKVEESHDLVPLRHIDGHHTYLNHIDGYYVYCYKDSGYRYPQVSVSEIEFIYISKSDVPRIKFVEYRLKNTVLDKLFNISVNKQVIYIDRESVEKA